MANKEQQMGFGRTVETKTEKIGGTLAIIVGIISLQADVVAIGLISLIVGNARTPKTA